METTLLLSKLSNTSRSKDSTKVIKMESRPRSEGNAERGSRAQRLALSKSYDQHHSSSILLARSVDESDLARLIEQNHDGHGGSSIHPRGSNRSGFPRRPRTTPQKARMQRFVLAPGQKHVLNAQPRGAIFMTHLPDSPPRSYNSTPSEDPKPSDDSQPSQSKNRSGARKTNAGAAKGSDSIFTFPTSASSPPRDESAGLPMKELVQRDPGQVAIECEAKSGPTICTAKSELRSTPQHEDEDSEHENGNGPDANELHPEVDEPSDQLLGTVPVGPNVVDLASSTTSLEDPVTDTVASPSQEQCCIDQSLGNGVHKQPGEEKEVGGTLDRDEDDEEESEDEEDIFQELLAARTRFQEEELERENVRQDLEAYVSSLTARTDDDGAQWIKFPKNYQQILSLMTERDVREVASAPAQAEISKASNSKTDRQKSWSEVLIENSLSKQQAYGTLDDAENGTGDDSQLAAKIALKIARVRQLDAVLEEKLGANLYDTGRVVDKNGKKKPSQSAQSQDIGVGSTRSRTFMTQPSSIAKPGPEWNNTPNSSRDPGGRDQGDDGGRSDGAEGGGSSSGKPSSVGAMNFVERNRKVIENGARSNLTREEEARLQRLIPASPKKRKKKKKDDGAETGAKLEEATNKEEEATPSEYRLDRDEEQAIEQLLSARRDAFYQPTPAPALDDIDEEDEEEEVKEATAESSKSKAVLKSAVPSTCKVEKEDRLRRKRLKQIDAELQFLKEHEVVAVLPDPDGRDEDDSSDDVSDGMTSEHSYMTSASMLSTCSTRSGVTRRQLRQFVAMEVHKSSAEANQRASSDEIQRLLFSLSHLYISRPTTTATAV